MENKTLNFREKLREHHLKATPARLSILAIFEKHEKPLPVKDLANKLKKIGIDIVTIYRNLETLEKVGMVKKILIDDSQAHYELNLGHHHHHLVCNNCKQIEDIEINDHGWIEKKLQDKKFTVLNHSFEFFGLCQNCASLT